MQKYRKFVTCNHHKKSNISCMLLVKTTESAAKNWNNCRNRQFNVIGTCNFLAIVIKIDY